MKISKTSLLILILTIIMITLFIPTINASQIDPNYYEPNEIEQDDISTFTSLAGQIAGVVQIIGTIVSVGALMIIGIRYIISSAEEKAEYKQRLVPYVIGAVILFGASNLVNIIYTMFHE